MVVCSGCVYTFSYLRQVESCLQWGVKLRQVGSWQPGCVYSVSYFRQVDGYLQWGVKLRQVSWQP